MIDTGANAYFDVEVLIRVPGQPKPNSIGYVRAPMRVHGGYLARAGIEVDLKDLITRMQDAVRVVDVGAE